MSGFEAADNVQPRRQARYYRYSKRRKSGYSWAVFILFTIVIFLCVNNYLFLNSYYDLKNQLSEANSVLESVNSAKANLDDNKSRLEEINSAILIENQQLKKENILLKDDYEKASRGRADISIRMEELEQQLRNLQEKNQELVDDNIALQNSLKMAASVGLKPQSYTVFEGLEPRKSLEKGSYVGKFLGTAYTPSVEECGNNKGITNSGKPIVPGVTLAVDKKYWPFGTVFYIKGLGYAVAMDTGSGVKGKYRFDFSVLDKKFARQLGSRKWDVYLVKMGKGKISDLKL